MLWDRVGWVGRGQDLGHVIHGTNPYPYPSWLIINSSDHQQFLCWGTSRSANMDSRFLRNLILIPITKVASAHPSIYHFQIFRHMIDETFSHPYI